MLTSLVRENATTKCGSGFVSVGWLCCHCWSREKQKIKGLCLCCYIVLTLLVREEKKCCMVLVLVGQHCVISSLCRVV